ncbi:MAG TPA: cation:proton antiporter, partial [Clostridia bacterium]|nr:cation:proton antiporter [Clostridia bacterium]
MPAFPIELTDQLRFILDLGASIGAALVGGVVAVRLGQPAILGYLIAGMFIGPFTPGFVGDVERIAGFADLGVVLLLFALGIEFSLRELRAVARVAVPGGLLQIGIVLVAGTALSALLGIEIRAALVIGACLSISSTLVVLKSLLDRGELDSLHGRAAVGWAIVQDIVTILFIVALPPLAGADLVGPLLLSVAKAAIFLALAYVVGTQVLPRAFQFVARLGSNELFLLAVTATAFLTAFVSSAVFGLSIALGAFVAGILVSESDLSYQAAAEVIPFRDLF